MNGSVSSSLFPPIYDTGKSPVAMLCELLPANQAWGGQGMSKLPVNSSASADQMAETIFGEGVTVVSATYTGDSQASGIYSDGDTVSPGVTPSDSGVILSTGKASELTNSKGEYNQDSNQSSNMYGADTVEGASDITGVSTYDAAVLETSFTVSDPNATTMTMQFVFSSEEYPEYTSSIYQDFVGVWVNDEYVPMEIGNINPGAVNDASNENLYIDNSDGAYNTEMDGFTATMTLTFPIDPDAVNTVRIAIADVGDSSYDSNLMIAADSMQTSLIAMTDDVTIGLNDTKTVDLLDNDTNSGSSLKLTQINGQDVAAGDKIVLSTGQVIEINADNTISVTSDGDEDTTNITYTVENENGVSDVGFVSINQTAAPCFTSGTLIRTPYGDIPVEDIEPGDLVETYDDGAQPVRWVGQRTVPAEGKLAPIRIAAGTFGDHQNLLVSPQHRILIRDGLAEILFDHCEVLVAARDLVNGTTVRRQVGGVVRYHHLLFDRHQIVFSQGLETESFLPGPQITNIFEADVVQELGSLFPELDVETGQGYGGAARPALKKHEAGLLRAHEQRVA